MGRLVKTKDNNGENNSWEISNRYNSLNELEESKNSENFNDANYTDTTKRTFHSSGQPNLFYYPSSSRKIKTDYDNGLLRKLWEQRSSQLLASFNYKGSTIKNLKFPNGLSFGLSYNSDQEIFQIRTYTGDNFENLNNMITGHRYTYNSLGMIDADIDLKTFKASRYIYDGLYRLRKIFSNLNSVSLNPQSSENPTGTINEYDDNGNLLITKSGRLRSQDNFTLSNPEYKVTSFYNEMNQLGRIKKENRKEQPHESTINLKYDRNGNVVRYGQTSYRYDYKNRLLFVRLYQSDQFVSFRIYYNSLNKPVRIGSKRYVWDGDNLIQEYDENDEITRKYIRYFYADKSNELISFETNVAQSLSGKRVWKFYFVHKSRSGNVEFITDTDGDIVERYSTNYKGLPVVKDRNNVVVWPEDREKGLSIFRDGEFFHKGTGLFFVGSRAKHPTLGRFMQRDPNGAHFDPLAYGNSYTFAANNSINFNDTGNIAIPVVLGFALASIFNAGLQYATTGKINLSEVLIAGGFGAVSGGIGGKIWSSATTMTRAFFTTSAIELGLGVSEGYTIAYSQGRNFTLKDAMFGAVVQLATGGLVGASQFGRSIREGDKRARSIEFDPDDPDYRPKFIDAGGIIPPGWHADHFPARSVSRARGEGATSRIQPLPPAANNRYSSFDAHHAKKIKDMWQRLNRGDPEGFYPNLRRDMDKILEANRIMHLGDVPDIINVTPRARTVINRAMKRHGPESILDTISTPRTNVMRISNNPDYFMP